MLKALLSIFRSDNPLHAMGEDFAKMMEIVRKLTTTAGNVYFGDPLSVEARTDLYREDVLVNKLERGIRKRVIAHLSLAGDAAGVELHVTRVDRAVERVDLGLEPRVALLQLLDLPLHHADLVGETLIVVADDFTL